MNRWNKPTVSARDLYIYGPNCIRDRETVSGLTQSLVEHGWLVPIPTRRRGDTKKWQIVRDPSSVISPRDESDFLAPEALSLPDAGPAAAAGFTERFYSLADLEEPEDKGESL
jgi:hypothetical protein